MTTTRREFVARLGAAALMGAGLGPTAAHGEPRQLDGDRFDPLPWYRRTLRWGQTNITEIDPARYDIDWWRRYWRRTAIQE